VKRDWNCKRGARYGVEDPQSGEGTAKQSGIKGWAEGGRGRRSGTKEGQTRVKPSKT